MPFPDKPAEETEVKDEILDMIGDEPKPSEESEEEEETTEEEKDEVVDEEEEETPPKKKEKSEEESEEEEEEEEPKGEKKLALTEQELKDREELAVLRSREADRKKAELEKDDTPAPEPEVVEFVSQEDSEKLLNEDGTINVENLNALMNKVANAAATTALKSIPEVVGRQVNEVTTNKNIIDDFYKEHPGLAAHRSYVGFVANRIGAEKPELTLRELLAETAVEVKKEMKISDDAEEIEEKRDKDGNIIKKKKKKAPRKPKGGGEHSESEDEGSLQSEINEMIDK